MNEKHREIAGKCNSIEDFLEIPLFCNMQTRYLSGNRNNELSEKDYEIALKRIKEEVYFGITEMFDESVFLMQKHNKWNFPYYKARINQAPGKNKNKLSSDTTNIVQEANAYDIKLYNKALEIFQERLNKIPQKNLRFKKFMLLNKLCQKSPVLFNFYKLTAKILIALKLNPERF